jgi:hypothetical protein
MKVKIGKYKDDGNSRDVKIKFSRDDLISLDCTLAIIIHAALEKFQKYANTFEDGEYETMLEAFRIVKDAEHMPGTQEQRETIKKGLHIFADRFTGLWF